MPQAAFPSFLTPGSGIWGFVQTKYRADILNGIPTPLGTGLDHGWFPYPDAEPSGAGANWTAANESAARSLDDDPGITTIPTSLAYTYQVRGDYSIYVFYKPVDDSVGTGTSVFVPVQFIPWRAYGTWTFAPPTTWGPQSDDGSEFTPGSTTYPALSSWPIWP